MEWGPCPKVALFLAISCTIPSLFWLANYLKSFCTQEPHRVLLNFGGKRGLGFGSHRVESHLTELPVPCSVALIWMSGVVSVGRLKSRESEVAQLYPTLCDPMDCRPPGSSVQGIFQAGILEWVAISCSRGFSRLRDWTRVSCPAGRLFTVWATREAQVQRDRNEGKWERSRGGKPWLQWAPSWLEIAFPPSPKGRVMGYAHPTLIPITY